MIKLKTLLKEFTGEKIDSLPNSKTREFQGLMTIVEKRIDLLRRRMQHEKGGAITKRKGDINYTYWNTYTNPRRSPLQEIADTVRKMEKIGYDNAKRATKRFKKQMK
jgi:hypothetical protein